MLPFDTTSNESVSIALSCTIFELFDVEEYRDLEIYVSSHSSSLEIAPVEKSRSIQL